MRLKGQHATGHTTLRRLAAQEREHGLVAAVHAVKVANRQGAGAGHTGVLETAKNFHEFDIFLIAGGAGTSSCASQVVIETLYIVTERRPEPVWGLAQQTFAVRVGGF
jgi:hypothetical protein